jgi:hypothetical protein
MFLSLRRRLEVGFSSFLSLQVFVLRMESGLSMLTLTVLVALYCVDANPIAIFVVNFIAIM